MLIKDESSQSGLNNGSVQQWRDQMRQKSKTAKKVKRERKRKGSVG